MGNADDSDGAKKRKAFVKEFEDAFKKGMTAHAKEAKKAPKNFEKDEGIEEVVDTDDKHFKD